MAYDEALAERIRPLIAARGEATERKMFGGVTWMLQGNMACGVLGDDLCVRLLPEDADRALEDTSVRRFEMTGRPARGFVVIAGEAVAEDDALAHWVDAGADYALSLPAK
jgi:TfoX/Sxy family transcriptional regulator of competence genes